ncbi:hypothetical protein PVAP13_8NG243504 [Panicum virgatum]|uniref:Uncharacterized protein n=1 Tax=Panicum virgatum TaxID=38727 RepID=A0A8T0P643_PANVG|nr:hypothetical protein PVAP13_8NG243504 [Panicum virgatum]
MPKSSNGPALDRIRTQKQTSSRYLTAPSSEGDPRTDRTPAREKREHQEGATMAELGGLLASDILKVVCQRIGLAIGDRIKLQANFIHNLEGMKMTQESVAALLNDAERRSIEEETWRFSLARGAPWPQ